MKRASVTSLIVVLICLLASPDSASAATAGADCSSIGKSSARKGLAPLICAGIPEYSLWVAVPAQPKTRAIAMRVAVGKLSELTGFDAATYVVEPASVETAQADSPRITTLRDSLSMRATAQLELASRFAGEAAAATALTATLHQQTAGLVAVKDQAKKDYLSLKAELDAMYPAYSAAYQARSAYLACVLLKSFGAAVGSCGSAIADELNRQTTIAYHAKEATVQAALAAWQGAIDSYYANLDKQAKLLQLVDTATARSSLAAQNGAAIKSAQVRATEDLRAAYGAIDAASQLPGMVANHLQLLKVSTAAVAKLKVASGEAWSTAFQRAVAALQVTRAHADALQHKLGESLWNRWVAPSVTPVWLPEGFSKASANGSISHPDVVDFGWKWTVPQVCGDHNCDAALVSVSRDCIGGQLTVEYRTSAGVAEARSISLPVDLQVGNPIPVAMESKYSATAVNVQVTQLTCMAIGALPIQG